ncbi:hypothetical protein Bca4012_071822 [Brassica carinata]
MYMHRDATGRVTKEYLAGLETFMHQADSTPLAKESGFTPNYYIWFQHGEGFNYDQNEASSSNSNFQEKEPVDHHLHNEYSYHRGDGRL